MGQYCHSDQEVVPDPMGTGHAALGKQSSPFRILSIQTPPLLCMCDKSLLPRRSPTLPHTCNMYTTAHSTDSSAETWPII